jgi:hypothetical protein
MMMERSCEELEFQCLSQGLAEEILNYSLMLYDQKVSYSESYGQFENQDSNNIAYIQNPKEYIRRLGLPRPVSFWKLNDSIQRQLVDHFSQNEFLKNLEWKIQFVKGGSFVAPHKDKATSRTKNILYLIQTGDDNVTTSWWTPKIEFQEEIIPETRVIPFEKLNLIETYTLEEGKWYQLDVSKIHSVGTHTNHRIGISAGLL